jgi:hypothetical protein
MCFAMFDWFGERDGIVEAGGSTVLTSTHSYEHHSIDEPAILLGGAFVVEVEEKVEEQMKS